MADSILVLKNIFIYDCVGIKKSSGRQYTKTWLTEIGSNK